jgi:hypothetical protein
VLFGGYMGSFVNDTWTWDGSDWTKQAPAHSPPKRYGPGMADDEARARVVLFGGYDGSFFGDTWTWDGSDWTKQAPPVSPPRRYFPGMVYDAGHGQVALFGGSDGGIVAFGDTWIWNGTGWSQRLAGSIALAPRSGPPGSAVRVEAWGFATGELVKLAFVDSTQGRTFLGKVQADRSGGFRVDVTIPLSATPGKQHIKANGVTSGEFAKQTFTVT